MKDYLKIEPTIALNSTDEIDLAVSSFSTHIKTWCEVEENEDDFEVEIGYILAYRFDLMYKPETLIDWADMIEQDVYEIAEFFFNNEKNYSEIELSRYLFYIDRVYIEPRFRGKGFAVRSVAMFLKLFAKQEVVCCHPFPTVVKGESGNSA